MAPRPISNNIEVWLQHAIDIDNDIRRLALDDEDLRVLGDWIELVGFLDLW
jgi:hypothetical protein